MLVSLMVSQVVKLKLKSVDGWKMDVQMDRQGNYNCIATKLNKTIWCLVKLVCTSKSELFKAHVKSILKSFRCY